MLEIRFKRGDIYRQARNVHIWPGDADAIVARFWVAAEDSCSCKVENLDIG